MCDVSKRCGPSGRHSALTPALRRLPTYPQAPSKFILLKDFITRHTGILFADSFGTTRRFLCPSILHLANSQHTSTWGPGVTDLLGQGLQLRPPPCTYTNSVTTWRDASSTFTVRSLSDATLYKAQAPLPQLSPISLTTAIDVSRQITCTRIKLYSVLGNGAS